MLGLLLAISTCLTLAYLQSPNPQAILMLGRGHDREVFTAQFAQVHPGIPIWLSSGIPIAQARTIFQSTLIANQRLHFDYCAIETVTKLYVSIQRSKCCWHSPRIPDYL